MRAYVCVAPKGTLFFYDIAELVLFPGNPARIDGWGMIGPGWVLANGQSLPINWYAPLYSLIGWSSSFSTSPSYMSFTVPSIPAPASGLYWWIAANGNWPYSN